MKRSICSILLLAQLAFANPSGGKVIIKHSATISDATTNHVKVDQHMEKAIIEWESFSISHGEKTTFNQPSSNSIVLNRVKGLEPSKIYGTLEANGEVVLVNQNGVIVGKTGEIHAARFLASVVPISDKDFFGGSYELPTLDVNSMINIEGRIEATKCEKIGGRIFLVADEVQVSGELIAKEGQIDIHGNSISLNKDGFIDVSGVSGDAGRASIIGEEWVDFSGTILAKGGLESGNGGHVEVSTRDGFSLTGEVSTMAPKGKAGMFLIDPTDVTISGAGDLNTAGPTYSFTGDGVTINDANLTAFLNASPVTISTANGTDQNQSGTIRIAVGADFSLWTAANDLMLIANEDFVIPVGASIANGGTGGVHVQAGGAIDLSGEISTMGGNISLLAGPESGVTGFNSTGSVLITSSRLDTTMGGGMDGAITIRGYDVTSIGTPGGTHATNTGNISVFAQNNARFSGDPNAFTTTTGRVSIHANQHITHFPGGGIQCLGAFSGVQIDCEADYNHTGSGDYLYGTESGNSSGIQTSGGGSIFIGGANIDFRGASPSAGADGHVFVQTTAGSASVELQATNDIVFLAGNGAGNGSAFISATSDVLLRAGNDINFQGGSGTGGGFIARATISGTGNRRLIAGNDIHFTGGNVGTGTSTEALVSGNTVELSTRRNIVFTPGMTASDNASISASAGPPVLRAGGNILFSLRAFGGQGYIDDNGMGCDVRAGGDIQYATDLVNVIAGRSIYFEADASIVVYPAQTGSFLTTTPLSTAFGVTSTHLGAYRVDTRGVGGGITFTTIDGDITLYSGAKFASGLPADILFDNPAVLNAQTLNSTSGNIQVGGFRNTHISNTIASNTGAILIATGNTMNVNTPSGYVIAGGPITLIVDEETPSSNGSGFFNNFNSGIVSLDPDQRIAIYAVSGPRSPSDFSFPTQVHLGNLDPLQTWDGNLKLGLLSKYSTSFQNGGPVHGGGFSAYVAGFGVFGSPVVWYKVGPDLQAQTASALYGLQAIRDEMPERLWMQQFSILSDTKGYEKHLEAHMEHQRRDKTISCSYACTDSRYYILRETMSGGKIRIRDFYEEFVEGPFWRSPTLMQDLNWMETE